MSSVDLMWQRINFIEGRMHGERLPQVPTGDEWQRQNAERVEAHHRENQERVASQADRLRETKPAQRRADANLAQDAALNEELDKRKAVVNELQGRVGDLEGKVSEIRANMPSFRKPGKRTDEEQVMFDLLGAQFQVGKA